MSGYLYGEKEPVEPCPYCGAECTADFVDVGVGYTQCGPFHCLECGASEIGSHDAERLLSADERRTGWYGPGQPPGSSANVIGGKVVSARMMEEVYRAEYPASGTDEWWEEIRKAGS